MKVLRSLLIVAFAGFAISVAAADVPARPEFGVLDPSAEIPLPILKATERMISEHERLTGEQISLYVAPFVARGELRNLATAVLEEWKKTAPRPLDSLVILIDPKHGALEIRTALGMDAVLPASKVENIRRRFFRAEWAAGKPTRAIVLTFVEVLRGIGSPLADADQVTDTFERAGFIGGWTPTVPIEKSWVVTVFVAIGFLFAGFVLLRILVGEVHYTETGWFRVPVGSHLLRLLKKSSKGPKLVTGGGVSGSY